MGEFVESSLEALLSVFEQLRSVQILSPEEVTGMVKRCRRYEYQLQKMSKNPDDFIKYGDYFEDVITLIRSRRARLDYWHKKNLIEKQLLLKIASLYRRCCDRFQGNFELWRKLISFLHSNQLRRQLSKTYTRALQIHGRNVNLRVESALWEFFTNGSVENSRAQLQLAIRMDPAESKYYEALFRLEIHFVDKIMGRRKFLQKTAKKLKEKKKEKGDGDSDVDDAIFDIEVNDAVLQLRVAEIVVNSSLKSVPAEKHGAMLISMWNSLRECKNVFDEPANRLRLLIDDKINELENEDTQLFIIRKAVLEEEDEFYSYEKAVENLPSEKMYRIFLNYCEEKLALMNKDPILEMKRNEIYAIMLEKGWIKSDETLKIESNVQEVTQGDSSKELLQKALEVNPTSSVFWSEWLQYRMENESFDSDENIKDFLNELNKALKKVPSEDCFPLWELAIDFAITYTPDQVEKVFEAGHKTAEPTVASKIKIIRLGYLKALVAEGHLTRVEMLKNVKNMILEKPNDSTFYLAVAEQEIAESDCDHSLIKLAYNFAINENGKNDAASWLEFIRYSLKYDPASVGSLHQRAMMKLEPSLCDEFVTSWTFMKQSEAKAELQKEKEASKRKYEVEVAETKKRKK